MNMKTLSLWAPYFLAVLSFLFWRLVIFKFPTYQPIFLQDPQSSLWTTSLTLAKTILLDVIQMGAYAWVMPIRTLSGINVSQPSSLAAIGLVLISFILFIVYLSKLGGSNDEILIDNTWAAWCTCPVFHDSARHGGVGWRVFTGLPFGRRSAGGY
jgi:hypothetical protein